MVIAQALQARGIDADLVLREAGIDPDIREKRNGRVPFAAQDRLFQLVVQRTGDPSIGLDLVEYINPTIYEALSLALLCSSTVRNFFRRFERFFDVVSTLERGEFIDTDYGGYFVSHPRVPYSETTLGCHADAFCAIALKFIRLVYSPDFKPMKVDLAWMPPAECHQKYRRYFGCEVNFSAPMTAIHLRSEDLHARLAGSNAALAYQNDQLAKAMLAEIKKDNLRSRVYARLIEFLPSGDCSREKVAASLYMSESAFRIKLKAEGTTYQHLLDRTRTDLARQYLESGMSISETAYLLGFTDSSNFSRAFKRWVGESPSQFRKIEDPDPAPG